ncbi:ricin B lectin domain-containing protein [Coprinopsis sp. MPI-PUGE-AT-0042]|nr:ricin B lectin domain-containing protein [Coprinopsis sp. MPI-PUGE-AT-0042]
MPSSTRYRCVFLSVFWLRITHVLATPLRACQNSLTINGRTNGTIAYPLTGTSNFSQYIECTYARDQGDGSIGVNWCWYDYQSYQLLHYPNTPVRLDSHPACPTTLPFSSLYRIRSFVDTTKCITAAGEYDGAPVELQACRTDIWRPEQVFHFDGNLIKPLSTDKCLDVKDGNPNSGTRLQVWTCSTDNPNQVFEHWSKTVLIVPEDHINWATQQFQCLDLPDGNTANGTPIQIWGCDYQNPNQHWRLEPVL